MTAGIARHLFECFGIELEYMIVDCQSLSIRPIADHVLSAAAGELVNEVELGELAWSNELALHVVELKTNGPAASLTGLAQTFQEHVRRINDILSGVGARLMPTGMHPWMDPDRELRIWPHDDNPIYEAYHRIFNCRGHGWANLQSMHLNLPFADDAEFARLHAAIRLLLPIMPVLAASSPLFDGRISGLADSRLEVYRHNAKKIPSVTGEVIPESVSSRAEYEQRILSRIYRDIAPYDPDAVLQHEWLNSRGAIARFERQTIEIRVLDVQECPAADLAICNAIIAVLRTLTSETFSSLGDQLAMPTQPLSDVFQAVVRDAHRAVIDDPRYLALLGRKEGRLTAGELWHHLVAGSGCEHSNPLKTILREGPLAERILARLHGDLRYLPAVYRDLCDCLGEGRLLSSAT